MFISVYILCKVVFGKSLNLTFANSEDPDEMQHYAALHQSLHCL